MHEVEGVFGGACPLRSYAALHDAKLHRVRAFSLGPPAKSPVRQTRTSGG
jgi:hypothetical protein